MAAGVRVGEITAKLQPFRKLVGRIQADSRSVKVIVRANEHALVAHAPTRKKECRSLRPSGNGKRIVRNVAVAKCFSGVIVDRCTGREPRAPASGTGALADTLARQC